MYNKKENEKPLFAEVKSCDDEVRQQATNKIGFVSPAR